MKIEVEASHYMSSRDFFIIGVYANFRSFSQGPYPAILYLKDGKQCRGTLSGGRFQFNKDRKEIWYLVAKSSEIQNPEAATIVAIETLG